MIDFTGEAAELYCPSGKLIIIWGFISLGLYWGFCRTVSKTCKAPWLWPLYCPINV